MLGIGGGEMVALAILALLVFGPEGLPEIMKTVARTIRAFKTAASDFQTEVNTALTLENQKNETLKRRRRPALPVAEQAELAQLPTVVEESTPGDIDAPRAGLPSPPESDPDSPPAGESQTTTPASLIPSLDDEMTTDFIDQHETLTAPNAQSAPMESSEPEDDDEFGPRRPMARPDRSAEAVLFLEPDDGDQEKETSQASPPPDRLEEGS